MLILASQLRLPQKLKILMCLMLALVSVSPGQVLLAAQERYVVNLLSMKQIIDLDKVSKLSSVQGRYGIIVYSKPLKNTTTNVLSVGYFSDINQASKVARSLDGDFNGAYVSRFLPTYTVLKTIDAETKRSATKAVENTTVANNTTAKSAATLGTDRLDQIMVSARTAIRSGDNRKAIQLFSAVLTAPENKHSVEALELLGLARERNNQYNHAVNIYNKYIKQYPESKGIRRVRQRLAVLTTATKRVDATAARKDGPVREKPWSMSGSLSQSYRDNNGDNSELYTFLSVGGRKRNDDTDIKIQFTGSRTSPLTGDSDTDFQISELYTDIQATNNGMSAKLGRMRSRSGGLYSRLDGLIISYDDQDITKYNIMLGLPVDSAREFLFDSDNDKLVYGINTDLLFFDKSLDINAYILEQRNDNLLDRRAVGAEARYFKSDLSIFSLFDYDISYDQTSIFMMNGNWKTTADVTLFFNVDYRSSPFIATGNALIGQTVTDLGTLVAALGEDAVRQLALDRSSTSRLLSLGMSWPMYKATTVRADVTATTVSSTPDSGGVTGTPEVGPDYYYSLQFVTTDYFDLRDTTILQFQYTDTETSRKASVLANTRIPLTQNLRISPRAILSFTNLEAGQNRTDLRTSMRTDYRYSRDLHMDVDLGMDFSNIEQPDSGSKLTNYYLVASYRWLF